MQFLSKIETLAIVGDSVKKNPKNIKRSESIIIEPG
jgi:hypothetical protein